jgi:formate/nitrite transporter FocA (FNT family)
VSATARRERDRDQRDPAVEEALDRTIADGRRRLARPWPSLTATALMGGLEIGTGLLALLVVEHETGSHLAGSLAFTIGLIAVLLGQSELFTEDFLVPVTAVAARQGTLRDLARLWTVTLLVNLAGGWVITFLLMVAYPDLHAEAVAAGTNFAALGITPRSFCLALVAGAAMTLMTWMQGSTRDTIAKIAAAVSIGFLVVAARLFHSVFDSLLMFAALHTGDAPFGYLDWLRQFLWASFGNVVGGVALVTVLRLVQGRHKVQERRAEAARD